VLEARLRVTGGAVACFKPEQLASYGKQVQETVRDGNTQTPQLEAAQASGRSTRRLGRVEGAGAGKMV